MSRAATKPAPSWTQATHPIPHPNRLSTPILPSLPPLSPCSILPHPVPPHLHSCFCGSRTLTSTHKKTLAFLTALYQHKPPHTAGLIFTTAVNQSALAELAFCHHHRPIGLGCRSLQNGMSHTAVSWICPRMFHEASQLLVLCISSSYSLTQYFSNCGSGSTSSLL